MNTENLFLNVRKAYRLLYEVQDSAKNVAEYYFSKLKFKDYAGLQLFSYFPEKKKPALDEYADIKVYSGKWSWDLFPCYMFEYYFTSSGHDCMSMVCVMDDGGMNAKSILDTSTYTLAEDSSSYVLLTYVKYSGTEKERIWYYNLYPNTNSRDAIFQIGKDLQTGEVFERNTDGGHLISVRFSMDIFVNQQKCDEALENFVKTVKEYCKEDILKETPTQLC